MSNVLVGVVIRKSRKVVSSTTQTKERVNGYLVDEFCYDVSKAMEAWDMLKQSHGGLGHVTSWREIQVQTQRIQRHPRTTTQPHRSLLGAQS